MLSRRPEEYMASKIAIETNLLAQFGRYFPALAQMVVAIRGWSQTRLYASYLISGRPSPVSWGLPQPSSSCNHGN